MTGNSALRDYLHFFWAGIVKHGQTGALLPSQKRLLDEMIAPIPRHYRGRVVELGAGTGCLTVRLREKCPEASILACEINPVLAEDARRNLVGTGVNGRVQVLAAPAQEVLKQLIGKPEEKPGYIVSGLPLGNLERPEVLKLMRMIRSALPRGGMFVQAQYLLLDRKNIQVVFGNVRTVPVLLNFPPIFVYYAQRTR